MQDLYLDQLYADVQDIRQAAKQLDTYTRTIAQATLSIERLEAVRDVVLAYGISRPMMEAVDHNHELTQASILPAYEQLSLTNSEHHVQISLEKLSDTLKDAWKSLIEFFKKTGRGVMEFGRAVGRGCRTQEGALNKMTEAVNSIELDAILSKTTECKAFNKEINAKYHAITDVLLQLVNDGAWADGTGTIVSELNRNTIPDLNAVAEANKKIGGICKKLIDNKDGQGLIGLRLQLDHNQISLENVKRVKPTAAPETKTLDAHGFDTAFIRSQVRDTLAIVRRTRQIESITSGLSKRYSEQAGVLERQLRNANSFTSEELAARKNAVETLKKLVGNCTTLVRIASSCTNQLFNNTRTLVSSAKKAQKKK